MADRANESFRLLLVDDEALVRTVMARALRLRGHVVWEVGDGRSALALLSQPGVTVDLVITDTRMPEMSGWELIARVRALRPSQRILRISAFSPEDERAPPGAVRDVPFLAKPFDFDLLETRIRSLMGGRPPGPDHSPPSAEPPLRQTPR
jgi:CheY-like chemotaxis protein